MMQTPEPVEIVKRTQEASDIITLHLRLLDEEKRNSYSSAPGQFNMLYVFGVGEVPISIVGESEEEQTIIHTIRIVGRVTQVIEKMQEGDQLGLRGPFGRGWPLERAKGKDIVIVTGGLGCAPVVAVINQAMKDRDDYKRIVIMQGVKHSHDLLWRESYERWSRVSDVQVLLAADVAGTDWPWATGRITVLLDQAKYNADYCSVMMCGPEGMMCGVAGELLQRNVPAESIWLSMERNMKCAVGQCGHCQFGQQFVCKNGPVFNFPEIKQLLGIRGV